MWNWHLSRDMLMAFGVWCPQLYPHCFCTVRPAVNTLKKAKNILELLWKHVWPRKLPEGPGLSRVCGPHFYNYWCRWYKSWPLWSSQYLPDVTIGINYFNPQLYRYTKSLPHSRKHILFNLWTLVHWCHSAAGVWELIKIWGIFNSIAARGVKLHLLSPRGVQSFRNSWTQPRLAWWVLGL